MAIDDVCPGDIADDPPPATDDGYSFSSKSIGEPTLDNCRTCRGTGEIVEFPAEADERMVACTTCGGTGEVWQ